MLRACMGDTELLNSLNPSPTRTRYIHFCVYRWLGGKLTGKTPVTYLYIVTYPNGRRKSGKVAIGN
ncbi:MAG: hypothetical protein IKA75_01320 [Bacteroidaceae bacterium]|nr:hypothetical protein [Bacteroidaceae bacterium]